MYQRPDVKRKNLLELLSLQQALSLCLCFAGTLRAAPIQRFEERRSHSSLELSLHKSSPPYAAMEDDLSDEIDSIPFAIAQSNVQSTAAINASPIINLEAGEIPCTNTAATIASQIRIEAEAQSRRFVIEAERDQQKQMAQQLRLSQQQGEVVFIRRSLDRKIASVATAVSATTAAPAPAQVIQKISAKKLGLSREQVFAALFAPMLQMPSAKPPSSSPVSVAVADRNPVLQAQAVTDVSPGKAVFVSGNLNFTGGLAITDRDDKLFVFRQDRGEIMEQGSVHLKDGRYDISILQKTGSLVAELRSGSGAVLGRGGLAIASLGSGKSSRFDRINLSLRPLPNGLHGSVQSEDGLPLSGALVAMDSLPANGQQALSVTRTRGDFAIIPPTEGSSGILRASKEGYWKALTYASVGKSSQIAMYTRDTISGLLAKIAPKWTEAQASQNSGIVWGRVYNSGQAVAHVQVSVGTPDVNTAVVYFDEQGRPDANLTETSSNGLYAMAPLPPGIQMLQARSNLGETSETLAIPVEAGATTRANIDLGFKQILSVHAFDPWNSSASLHYKVASLGREKVVESPSDNSNLKLPLSSSEGQAFIDVDGLDGYASERLALPHGRQEVLAPLINRDWLSDITGTLRINQFPHSGNVLGFVQGSLPFQANIVGFPQENVLYFDSQGKITKDGYGKPGGGYILFNVPEGLRTLVVVPKDSDRRATEVLLVENRVLSVSTIWLK